MIEGRKVGKTRYKRKREEGRKILPKRDSESKRPKGNHIISWDSHAPKEVCSGVDPQNHTRRISSVSSGIVTAARRHLVRMVYISVSTWTVRIINDEQVHLHDDALAPARGLARVLRLLNLPDHKLERLDDIGVVASGRLAPSTFELLRHLLALLSGDLVHFGLKVALVSDEGEGYPIRALFQVTERLAEFKKNARRERNPTRWFRILSRITRTISNDCLDATEYTIMYP